ncbi:MAG: META domain-containing protein [Xanthobacteraceae bacterium]|nr:MAG: META domain-containing protein [Xanthobacteraceae bacterium]
MRLVTGFVTGLGTGLGGLALVAVVACGPVLAADTEFPFNTELTLDARPMQGSKRLPTLEIGPNGESRIGLWCKTMQAQFSVANDTVIFIPGPLQDPGCPAGRAAADEALIGALTAATGWKRQGDILTLSGAASLRFRVNTN